MNASLRPLIYELVVHHRRVHKFSHLKLPDLVAVPELAFDVAKEASDSSDKQLSAIGIKILEGLAIEGITSGTGVASATVTAPSPALRAVPAPIPPPSAGNGRSYDREWERLETIAVDEAGPMGSQLVRKVRVKNPGIDPVNLKPKLADILGNDITTAIFDRYRTR